MTEYERQAEQFLRKANAICEIELAGYMVNPNWKETEKRNCYDVTLKTPLGSMNFLFWDSVNNTKISRMTLEEYAANRWKCHPSDLKYNEKYSEFIRKEFKAKKADAQPTVYDILACLTKYDVGTFENFCCEFGYDEDSRTAERIYFAAQKEYAQLCRIFTPEQMEELQEIN